MRDRRELNRLEIELLGDGVAADSHDVEFGGRRNRPFPIPIRGPDFVPLAILDEPTS